MTDDRMIEALAGIARRRDGRIDPADDTIQRERLVASFAARAARGRGAWGRPAARWAAAAVALSLAAAVAILVVLPGGDLDYAVQGGVASEEGYVQADSMPVTIHFTDGSRFVARPHSAGRVIDVDSSGARLLLERGTFSVAVVHAEGRAWSVAAGPYVVRVTGTRFDLSWSPDREELSLVLEEGKVAVRGPMIDDELSMQAGQIFTVRLPEGHFEVRSANLTVRPEPTATAVAGAPIVAPSASSPPPPPLMAPAPARVSWSRLVADGAYDQVLAEADARGVEGVLATGSLDDVVALGDAARYRGRGEVARKALASLWERFPDQRAGKSAAFLLGRLSEGAPASAIAWYDRYLAADPGGAYASEAMGRKLELLARTNRPAARTAAQQYLAAYPNGAHAAFARDLLR
jgi:hypothetical protein